VASTDQPEGRVSASCDCGWSTDVPARAWEWIEDRHLHAHNKGKDGLPATAHLTTTQYAEPEPEAEAD
jgi:hypothetical protein